MSTSPTNWSQLLSSAPLNTSYTPNWSDLLNSFGTPSGLGNISSGLAAAFPSVGNSSGSTSSNLNTNQNLSGATSGTTSGTTTAGYGAAGNSVIAQLLPLLSKLTTSTNLQPYQAQQTQLINQGSNNQQQNVDANFASRGLSTSPAAASAAANIQAQRQGAITNLNQQIPLLQNQLTGTNAGVINNILSSLPRVGSTTGSTSGTTSQSGSSSQAGNTNQNVSTSQGGGAAGLFGGIGAALAGLFG